MPSPLGALGPPDSPALPSLTRDSLRVPWDVSPSRSTVSATPSGGDPRPPGELLPQLPDSSRTNDAPHPPRGLGKAAVTRIAAGSSLVVGTLWWSQRGGDQASWQEEK